MNFRTLILFAVLALLGTMSFAGNSKDFRRPNLVRRGGNNKWNHHDKSDDCSDKNRKIRFHKDSDCSDKKSRHNDKSDDCSDKKIRHHNKSDDCSDKKSRHC